MSRLCFGTYAKAMQKVMKSPNGNKDITELLLSLIIDNVEITNQSGDVFVVTDKMASDLLSFKINLQRKIVSASSDRVVSEAACDFFAETTQRESSQIPQAGGLRYNRKFPDLMPLLAPPTL